MQTLPGVPRHRIKKSGRFPTLFSKGFGAIRDLLMHSPQPFPWGSAPFAVQSRPVSNRTYSAEIPRLIHCRHSRPAATSRIIAYQKRSHARISLTHPSPVCKPFLPDFPDFFHFFLPAPHLVPPAALSLQNRGISLPIYPLPIKYIATYSHHKINISRQSYLPRPLAATQIRLPCAKGNEVAAR